MSDWESVTKIGKNVRSGGGGDRQTVIRGKGALNAAMRSGTIVATEKKYGTANASKSGVDGQFLTKVANNDDVVPQSKPLPKTIGPVMERARRAYDPPLSQKDLAQRLSVKPQLITELEGSKGALNKKLLQDVENFLNVRLQGDKIGEKKFKNRK